MVPVRTAHIPDTVEHGTAQVGVEIVGAEGAQHEILVLHEARRLGQKTGLVLAHPKDLGDDPRGAQRQAVLLVVLLGGHHHWRRSSTS
jgi:hypothetical protein